MNRIDWFVSELCLNRVLMHESKPTNAPKSFSVSMAQFSVELLIFSHKKRENARRRKWGKCSRNGFDCIKSNSPWGPL